MFLLSACSKFFGKPAGGSKPAPTQQTKLSFATKSAEKKEEEEGDKKSSGADKETKLPSSQGSASAKENASPGQGECAQILGRARI